MTVGKILEIGAGDGILRGAGRRPGTVSPCP
jgi:hypothetical protein